MKTETTKRKRCRKLTKAEREIVYAPPESNAGAGWNAKGGEPRRRFVPNRERDTTPTVDKEFK